MLQYFRPGLYLSETDGAGATQVVYTNEPLLYGNLVSQYRLTGGLWLPSYYLTDALGSSDRLTDSTGTVLDHYLYKAFGELLTTPGSTVNPFTYVGRVGYYSDIASLHLDYIRARWYQRNRARFFSIDPRRNRRSIALGKV